MTLPEFVPPVVPQKRLWGFWPTIGLSVAILAAYFAVQAGVLLIVFIIRLYSGELPFMEAVEMLATDGLASSLATIVAAPFGLLLTAVFIRLRGGIRVADYLDFKPISKKAILLLGLVFFAMLALATMAGEFLGDDGNTGFTVDLYRNGGLLPLLWMAIVFMAPVFEEVFFRGFMFVGLRASRLGTIGTIIITSFCWAILHIQYNLFGIIQILIMGLILGTVRHKTNSIWSPIIIHILWNAAVMVSVALYISSGG